MTRDISADKLRRLASAIDIEDVVLAFFDGPCHPEVPPEEVTVHVLAPSASIGYKDAMHVLGEVIRENWPFLVKEVKLKVHKAVADSARPVGLDVVRKS